MSDDQERVFGDPRSEEAIKITKAKVEHALLITFGRDAHNDSRNFQGRLSTDPHKSFDSRFTK